MKKKVLTVFIPMIMIIVGIFSSGVTTAYAEDAQEPVSYYIRSGDEWVTLQRTDYTVITESNIGSIDWDKDGWYVVYDNIKYYNKDIEMNGDIHLIMAHAAMLTTNFALYVNGNLTICEMSNKQWSTLCAGSDANTNYPGITGSGSVTVYGGQIFAEGGGYCSGIGGKTGEDSELDLTVYGGFVRAHSTGSGAGIGGGGSEGTVVSEFTTGGGDGGKVTIYGGKVEAWSEGNGAGIGGGGSTSFLFDGGDGGQVKIYGGEVTAYSKGNGAGIGGGDNGGDSGTFGFYGGSLHAYSLGGGVAVGHGEDGDDEDDYYTVGNECNWIETGTEEWIGFNPDWDGILHRKEVNLKVLDTKNHPIAYRTVSEKGVAREEVCDDYLNLNVNNVDWKDGWYVAEGNETYNRTVCVNGNAKLILKNGSNLTVNGGFQIKETGSLTIYAQPPEGSTPTGNLTAVGQSGTSYKTGIYGRTILHGGNVSVCGSPGAPGFSDNLTLYGGNITARGGDGAVAIGGGYKSWGGDIRLYGGSLTAFAGSGAARAIGPRRGDLCCAIIVGNDTVLLKSDNHERLDRFNAMGWNDILDGVEVSIIAVCPRSYVDSNDETGLAETKKCLIYDNLFAGSLSWTEGWYAASGSLTITGDVAVTGDVKLILEDDCTLNVNGGIRIADGALLTVYAQSDGNATGKLNVTGTDGVGIEGDATIFGGKITVRGGDGAAGIADGNIAIGGGSLTVIAGEGASEGFDSASTDITVVNKTVLMDKTTNEPIEKEDGDAWIDVLNGSTVSFYAVFPEVYLEYNADGSACEQKACLIYRRVSGDITALREGWYVAHGVVTVDRTLTVTGDVKLILADGCLLTVNGGICVNEGGNGLTIYAQSEDNTTMGKLVAFGADHSAGIGGGKNKNSGRISIHGGKIEATGGSGGDSIGGGAGIGGGEGGGAGMVKQGNGLFIYGGVVTARGGAASAGIGGGYASSTALMIWSGEVAIYGGVVTAYGGEYNSTNGGAGIGSGYNGVGDLVTIEGGFVTATGGFGAAGIGGGANGMGCILTVNGGNVVAQGGKFATGIGSGIYGYPNEEGGVLNFNGGALTAICGESGQNGIGKSQNGTVDTTINYGCVVDIFAGDDAMSASETTVNSYKSEKNPYVKMYPKVHTHDYTNGEYRDNGDGTHSAKCVICGEYCDEATAHSFTTYVSDNNATCVANGTMTAQCDYCTATHTVTEDGTAKGHSFSNYVYNNDATCTAEGTKTAKCDRCDVKDTIKDEDHPPLGHNFIGDYCDNGDGTHSRKCERCTEYGATENHIYDVCLCACGAEEHTDEDENGYCDLCGKFIIESYSAVVIGSTTLETGNWRVTGEISFTVPLVISGDVVLFMDDEAILNATKGILLDEGNTLTVYAQSAGDDMGKIVATGRGLAAGIGSCYDWDGDVPVDAGDLTVYGGFVTATGGMGAAGIGGGWGGNGGKVVINGGKIEATGGAGSVAADASRSAGIGGGWGSTDGGDITVNGVLMLKATGFRALGAGQPQGNEAQTAKINIAKNLMAMSGGKAVNEIDSETEIVIAPIENRFSGVSITLKNDIYINFYMTLTEDAYKNGVMTFTVGDRAAEVIAKTNANGTYFTCCLSALEMNETVTATFTYAGKTYIEEYSVARYIQAILDGDYSEKTKTLVKKIANYGHYAQQYLADIHESVTIGEDGYAETDKFEECDIDVESAKAALEDTFEQPQKANGVELYGRTVYFESVTALNYYVKVDGEDAPEANCPDKPVAVNRYKDNIYIVTVKDILVTELATDFTVTIDGVEFTGSVLDYCGAVMKTHDKDEPTQADIAAINAMASFYEYYVAATDYAASVTE